MFSFVVCVLLFAGVYSFDYRVSGSHYAFAPVAEKHEEVLISAPESVPQAEEPMPVDPKEPGVEHGPEYEKLLSVYYNSLQDYYARPYELYKQYKALLAAKDYNQNGFSTPVFTEHEYIEHLTAQARRYAEGNSYFGYPNYLYSGYTKDNYHSGYPRSGYRYVPIF
ncbi:uncharacterized protein LOC110841432 isoform X2 [Zootermopsis nevadensis]|uniref:uncharacterized protein LOC110841432 isoform X2 n=1 Tax=Zootermopsis nevadensis TaxID=136037 RepID=UPI000B8E4551|nr:uncharacterized protein LOC110841432 isoform X2 [Zootermopsis nevadensis]